MRTLLPLSVSLSVLGACGATAPRPLQAEGMHGPAAGPEGRVLVISATCGSLDRQCRETWAPTVDQIVFGALEFRGFDTIDPQTLRKDERQREEHIEEHHERVESSGTSTESGVGVVGIIPVGGSRTSSSSSVRVTDTRHRTVHLEGANFEDLRLEDKRALMDLAGANTVATTRVVVGANYGTWTAAQNVEVIVKLAAADTGEMRWASRCVASSRDYQTVEAAIENAARCATTGFQMKR